MRLSCVVIFLALAFMLQLVQHECKKTSGFFRFWRHSDDTSLLSEDPHCSRRDGSGLKLNSYDHDERDESQELTRDHFDSNGGVHSSKIRVLEFSIHSPGMLEMLVQLWFAAMLFTLADGVAKHSVNTTRRTKTDILIVTFIVALCTSSVDSMIADHEAVLQKFYEATDGDNWSDKWNLANDLCYEYGVECVNTRVTKLDLSSNNISGTIISDIGNLTTLQYSYLDYNQLTGTIPIEFVNLDLLGLRLHGNTFSCPIWDYSYIPDDDFVNVTAEMDCYEDLMYQYLGCYVDKQDPDRALSGVKDTNSPYMNVELCAGICQSYQYFGVQSGSQCFCGNSGFDRYPKSSRCTRTCNGDASEICGGSWANSVYELSDYMTTFCPAKIIPTNITCSGTYLDDSCSFVIDGITTTHLTYSGEAPPYVLEFTLPVNSTINAVCYTTDWQEQAPNSSEISVSATPVGPWDTFFTFNGQTPNVGNSRNRPFQCYEAGFGSDVLVVALQYVRFIVKSTFEPNELVLRQVVFCETNQTQTPAQTPTPTTDPTPSQTPTPTTGPTPVQTVGPTPVQTPPPTAGQTPTQTQTPTTGPTPVHTQAPTSGQTPTQTQTPTAGPTPVQTAAPTPVQTQAPTAGQTPIQTPTPTADHTPVQTPIPTANPIHVPSQMSTIAPSISPTPWYTSMPTTTPSTDPTLAPSVNPTTTSTPTEYPSADPTPVLTHLPTSQPTSLPTTSPQNYGDSKECEDLVPNNALSAESCTDVETWTQCSFQCDEEYARIRGATTFLCLDSGWFPPSNQLINCRGICPRLAPKHTAEICTDAQTGTACQLTCREGYAAVANLYYYCSAESKWIPAPPDDIKFCDVISTDTGEGLIFFGFVTAPIFALNVHQYSAHVPYSIISVGFEPTNNGTVELGLDKFVYSCLVPDKPYVFELVVGVNLIYSKIRSDNGSEAEYLFSITRQAAETDSRLSRLSTYVYIFSTKFTPNVTDYVAEGNFMDFSIYVDVATSGEFAVVEEYSVNGNQQDPTTLPLDMEVAENTIEVTVRAEDGSSSTYKITANRAYPKSCNEVMYCEIFNVLESCREWKDFDLQNCGYLPVQCSQPVINNADEHSVVKCHKSNVSEACEFECREGYTFNGAFPICSSNGNWEALPECIENDGFGEYDLILILIGVAMIILLGICVYFLLRRKCQYRVSAVRRWTLAKSHLGSHEIELAQTDPLLIRYSDLEDLNKLSQGNFGMVFTANWKKQKLVLKISHGKAGEDEVSEMVTLSSLPSHKNMIKTHGQCNDFVHPDTHARTTAIVLPFMENGSVRDYLKTLDGPLDFKTCARFALDMARGVKHMHNNGFVHRDIAARNFLLDGDFNVVISDFGLAREARANNNLYEMSKASNIPFRWTPLEGLNGRYSFASDVWMLGIAFWELFSSGYGNSKLPFDNVGGTDELILFLEDEMAMKGRDVPLQFPDCHTAEMVRFKGVIIACCRLRDGDRANLDEVIHYLETIQESDAEFEEKIDEFAYDSDD